MGLAGQLLDKFTTLDVEDVGENILKDHKCSPSGSSGFPLAI